MRAEQPGPYVPLPVDLREVTRGAELKQLTRVKVYPDSYSQQGHLWLQLGEAHLQCQESRPWRWTLRAYLPHNVTDPEHDSGYALSLGLVGVVYLGTSYHESEFMGFIENDIEHFRVPEPGYNPMNHPEAYTCKGKKYCKVGEPHTVVPEGSYTPKPNLTLFKQMVGRRVQISIGSTFEETD